MVREEQPPLPVLLLRALHLCWLLGWQAKVLLQGGLLRPLQALAARAPRRVRAAGRRWRRRSLQLLPAAPPPMHYGLLALPVPYRVAAEAAERFEGGPLQPPHPAGLPLLAHQLGLRSPAGLLPAQLTSVRAQAPGLPLCSLLLPWVCPGRRQPVLPPQEAHRRQPPATRRAARVPARVSGAPAAERAQSGAPAPAPAAAHGCARGFGGLAAAPGAARGSAAASPASSPAP